MGGDTPVSQTHDHEDFFYILNEEAMSKSKKVSKKVINLKKEIKARKAKIAKQEGKLKQLKKKLKKAA